MEKYSQLVIILLHYTTGTKSVILTTIVGTSTNQCLKILSMTTDFVINEKWARSFSCHFTTTSSIKNGTITSSPVRPCRYILCG